MKLPRHTAEWLFTTIIAMSALGILRDHFKPAKPAPAAQAEVVHKVSWRIRFESPKGEGVTSNIKDWPTPSSCQEVAETLNSQGNTTGMSLGWLWKCEICIDPPLKQKPSPAKV